MNDLLMQELALHEYLHERLVEEFPDIDEETLADTLEGLTTLNEKLAVVIRSQQDDRVLSEALRTRIEEMRGRLQRLEHRVEKKRELVATVMERADIRKITEPDFTVALRQTPPPLVVTDETLIPEWYWKPQPSKLDRQRLKEDLKSGEHILGVCLGNGGQTLAVRTR